MAVKVTVTSPPGDKVAGEAVRVAAEEAWAKPKKRKRDRRGRRSHEGPPLAGSLVFC